MELEAWAAISGAGAAHAGEDVVFIARGEHFRALRVDGLRVDSPDGDFTVVPAQAAEDPREVGPVDAVVLGVKAWQVGQAAEAMRPLIGPSTFVVPLQNGVEAPSQLAAVLGNEHVFGGFCYIVSFIVGPGHCDSWWHETLYRIRRIGQSSQRTRAPTP